MSPQLSKDSIYGALRTIDITGFQRNMDQSGIWSTPVKEQAPLSIVQISPSPNRFLQTPAYKQLTPGKIK